MKTQYRACLVDKARKSCISQITIGLGFCSCLAAVFGLHLTERENTCFLSGQTCYVYQLTLGVRIYRWWWWWGWGWGWGWWITWWWRWRWGRGLLCVKFTDVNSKNWHLCVWTVNSILVCRTHMIFLALEGLEREASNSHSNRLVSSANQLLASPYLLIINSTRRVMRTIHLIILGKSYWLKTNFPQRGLKKL